jgi:hypothetical protein
VSRLQAPQAKVWKSSRIKRRGVKKIATKRKLKMQRRGATPPDFMDVEGLAMPGG